MDPNKIKEIMATATEAVAGIEDPELKKIAFQTVLSHGLGEHSVGGSSKVKIKTKVRGVRKVVKASADKVKKKSDIRLTADQIHQLKSFFDEKKPKSEEDTVFELALYLTNVMRQEEFHEQDLLALYHSLIPSRPEHKPVPLDLDRIKRSIGMLVAPSRKKMWFEKAGDNYRLSAQGSIHANYPTSSNVSKSA